MALTPGSRLGSYEILSLLGEGGMGAVYRARDTRLGREVAIKVVLEAFIADRERLARFEREAKALAALNHPNIATLYGMEEVDGRHFIAMELVEGGTIAEYVKATPFTVERTVEVARQIAEGLEAAHERGIVHRDLKPANIKITPDDKVKVLDFGLAKAGAEPGGSSPSMSLANSPTLTAMGTQAGVILGTASYMSPEQARGASGDHRSDIFSFGVVLFEMLTGRQPFQGDTVSDVLASVLAREPELSTLPPDLAPRLKELVKRCLEKHPRRRWQAIGDVRHELEVIAADPRGASLVATAGSLTQSASANGPAWRRALPVAAAVLITAAATAGGFIAARPAAPPAPAVTRFIIPYGEKENRTITSRVSMAISPDGSRIAYVSNRDIVLRNLADFESRVVGRGSVANLASSPFSLVFSPDGKQLAYWDQGDEKIKRIDLTGGAPIPVCDATAPGAINWIGEYLYFSAQGGHRRVAAAGGQPEILVKTDTAAMLTAPWVLEDGRLLYSVTSASDSPDRWASAKIVVQRPGESTPTTLVEGGSDPRYVASGHLVYQVGGVLYARKFNPRTGALGDATSVVEGILRGATNLGAGFGWYAVSANGTLLYMPGPVGQFDRDLQLAWFDRNGKADLLPIPSGPYAFPRVSPNGKYIAFTRNDAKESSIWVYAVGGMAANRRLTFGGSDRHPVWSSDNLRVFFESGTTGNGGIFWQRADGSGAAEQLTKVTKDERHTPLSMSPDGTVLLFDRISTAADNVQQSQVTLMTYSFRDKTTAPFGGVTSQAPTGAVFSPDGKWVAYSVRETGQTINTTFVQPYPATRAKYQISTIREDGHHQVWSGDGKELFYTPGPGLLMAAVTVSTTPSFTFGPAPPVSRPFINQPPSVVSPFDVDRSGRRFLSLARSGTIDGPNVIRDELRVVLNWAEELKARVK